jgi:hypothetical protein
MNEAQEYYRATAVAFAEQINKAFESEETLKALFQSYFPGLPLERTDHWNVILNREIVKAWQAAGPQIMTVPVTTDIYKILRELHKLLDYNLYTQVALNLQNYMGWAYQAKDAEKELEILKNKWKGHKDAGVKLDPFESKAKMAKIVTDMEAEYNTDLSAIKALRIISQFGPLSSFRVSPKGSTPALADSKNLSMIGIGGDRFLKTISGLKVSYIVWSDAPNLLLLQPDGSFKTADIPYNFVSKSGGQILNEVLFSRWIAYRVYGVIDMTTKMLTVIPRMNSVMIIASQHVPELEALVKDIQAAYPVILCEGERKLTMRQSEAGA